MRVIVCGAGQVGSTIARHLSSEDADVTVIDSSIEEARRVDESYDVRGIAGHASHPEVLERAGARDADMLVAVTRSDEVNMVACQVAHSLFGVKRRIARLRHHGYLEPMSSGLYGAGQLPDRASAFGSVLLDDELQQCRRVDVGDHRVVNGVVRRRGRSPNPWPGLFATVDGADGDSVHGLHRRRPVRPIGRGWRRGTTSALQVARGL